VPVQRFSQGFKDISLSFKRHPVTNDLLALKNEDAIKRSVQNLIRIQLGEVFFNELVGTRITGALFELANDNFVDPIQTEIETTILNNEPRVKLTAVDVFSEPDSNSIDIKISYDLVGLSSPSQTLQFVLEPTRL
jgi:phage baseplate assembly protein W|tara:strand:+ start:58 stop:462 length:405 start_codon:yes stop_codon:yes gene_type:complete